MENESDRRLAKFVFTSMPVHIVLWFNCHQNWDSEATSGLFWCLCLCARSHCPFLFIWSALLPHWAFTSYCASAPRVNLSNAILAAKFTKCCKSWVWRLFALGTICNDSVNNGLLHTPIGVLGTFCKVLSMRLVYLIPRWLWFGGCQDIGVFPTEITGKLPFQGVTWWEGEMCSSTSAASRPIRCNQEILYGLPYARCLRYQVMWHQYSVHWGVPLSYSFGGLIQLGVLHKSLRKCSLLKSDVQKS